MPGNKYIEIDSTYRDRSLYPLPSQFIVPLSQSGLRDKFNSTDPVCDSTPVEVFNGLFDGSNNYLGGTVSSSTTVGITGIGNTTSYTEIIVTTSGHSVIDDYYVGAVLLITVSGSLERKRIIKYKYISSTTAHFSVENSFSSSAVTAGNAVKIYNPSDSTNIFIPTGEPFNNVYINYILLNQTTGEYKRVISYDGLTRIATVDSAFTSYLSTDVYSLRKTLAYYSGAAPSTGTISSINVSLSASASTVNDYYRGDFIRFYSTSTVRNDVRRITSYSVYESPPGVINKIINFSPSITVNINDPYEILQFSRDNLVPLNYTGSEVGSQEMVCYDITLINVIVPNKALAIGGGKRLPFYTHLYVEFANETSPTSGQTGLIYSNNPNSVKMLFRATIDDIAQPCNSNFLKFNGDNMVQTVKFKPNDNLRFSVRLHTGEPLQMVEPEIYSPLPPNPDIQISALFCINRV